MADIIGWKRGGGSTELVEMVKVEQVVVAWEWRATEKGHGSGTRIKESLDKWWRNEFASNQLRGYNLQWWFAGLVPARYSANPTNTDRERRWSLRNTKRKFKIRKWNKTKKKTQCIVTRETLMPQSHFLSPLNEREKREEWWWRNVFTGREESGRRWWMQTEMKRRRRLSMPISSKPPSFVLSHPIEFWYYILKGSSL